jgi:eukaryotic-like serine/threonine-protein kinase
VTTPTSQVADALRDRYFIERELGSGGMAIVYLALDIKHRRKVAVKVLRSELAAPMGSERFLREIEVAARLQHPNILPLHDSGEAGGFLYYVMPYVEGESLRTRLSREGELPVADAIRILQQVADALRYAHSHGVIHRDIKPDNVLLSGYPPRERGTVGGWHALVTDFGVAKALAESQRPEGPAGPKDLSTLTGTGLALGTPTYMAPEQAAADPHTDHRADIYALGVLGYEMLAGRPPFTGPSAQAIIAAQMTQTPAPLSLARASVPAALSAAIMRCLEKRPADRWQSADELLQTLEHPRSSGAVEAIPELPIEPHKTLLRRWPVVLLLVCGLIGLALLGALIYRQSQRSKTLDADLLAVAPFDTPDPKLALWHEGLVDLLSRNLDGAGPLRTVAPTTVIRRWSGRADPPSATQIGVRTGAGIVVYGSLIGAGADSARLTATALDVASGKALAEIELRDAANRMDRMADSLTVRLLRELGRTRGIQVLRTGSPGSTSLPALKAFLQGEQWFRRAAWDSAYTSYQRATELDPQFPLPYWRAGEVIGWQHSAFDSLSEALELRAGALNHGLAPRDSLLLTADSIQASLYSTAPRIDWTALSRLHRIAEELTGRYPDDVDSWYLLGEARYHWGTALGFNPRDGLAAFDRAIQSDSSFAPSYIHPIELSLWLGDPAAADRYARSYLALEPTDNSVSGVRLVHRILEARQAGPGTIDSIIRSAQPAALNDAWLSFRRSADSNEIEIRLARALAAAPAGDAAWLPSVQRERGVGASLLYRGHLREAMQVLWRNPSTQPAQVVELALLGTAPDSTTTVFTGWVDTGPLMFAGLTLPWWAERRDTSVIKRLARRSEALARTDTSEGERRMAEYTSQTALAYLALARRDTSGALRRFESLPDSLCPLCFHAKLTRAQLLSARKEDQKVAKTLDGWLIFPIWPSEILWTLERARVNERLGNRAKAAQAYQYVAEVWRHADPELQPYVAEAKQGLGRLTAER